MMIVKEDRRSEKIEGFTKELNSTLNQVTSQQIALDTAVHELEREGHTAYCRLFIAEQ